MMSDSEHDIWGYRSIRKAKAAEKPVSCEKTQKEEVKGKRKAAKKPGAVRSTTCTRNNKSPISNGITAQEQNSPASGNGGDVTSTPRSASKGGSKKVSPATPKAKHSGYCPSCQMPFSILLVQTPRWHVSECLDTPSSAHTECPDGRTCSSTIPSHYKRYSHSLLAQSRAAECFIFFPVCTSQSPPPPLSSSNTLTSYSQGDRSAFPDTARKLKSSQGRSPSSSQGSVKQSSLHAWLSSASQSSIQLSQESFSPAKASDLPQEDAACFISYSPLVSDQELFSEDDETDQAGPVSKLFSNRYHTDSLESGPTKCTTNPTTVSAYTRKTGEGACEAEEREADCSVEGVNWSICSSPVYGNRQWATTQCSVDETDGLLHSSSPIKTDPSPPRGFAAAVKEEKVWGNTQTFTQTFTAIRTQAAARASFSQGSSAMPVGAASSKGMKQMDIGVFFGLKPKAQPVKNPEVKLPLKTQSPNAAASSQSVKRPRKRKAQGSLGDADSLAGNTSVVPAQKWGRKRFRQSSAAEESKGRKQCPFYKKIPGTGFAVDAFQYGAIEGCSAYFLTHFHSDHYGGLTKKFRYPVYCSKITGNLVASKLRVEKQFINTLPLDVECVVDGVRVVLLDANHCPGAVLLLFILPDGRTVLHTGDFRADSSMERYPALIGRKIDTLYLDTTYCSPEYTFPPQQEAVQFAVNVALEAVALCPRTLVVCGTYSVGKEKVFLAIAEVLGCKVCVSQDKYRTMQCLECEEIRALLTTDWHSTRLHVLPMMQVNFKGLYGHLSKFPGRYERLLAFKPTGWTYSAGGGSVADIRPEIRGKVTMYGIPYSEHSSYLEMKRFVQFIRPEEIVPTVNVGSRQSRSAMEKHFTQWLSETGQSAAPPFKGK